MQNESADTVICDLTQSYSAKGGGVRTFLAEKRRFLLQNTRMRHALIIPGPENRVSEGARTITVEIASPRVPGSPNYRLLLHSPAVLDALNRIKPNVIECQDAYNLPWTALHYRRRNPGVVLIAGYHTDFPSVYVEDFLRRRGGRALAAGMKRIAYRYAANLYRRFDAFYTLTQIAADHFAALGVDSVHTLKLGADTNLFRHAERDEGLRAALGVAPQAPLLIYAGRIDYERKARVVVDAFKTLPPKWGAGLVMLGDGNEREALASACRGWKASFPGFVDDRKKLAAYLASSDIYVSAMENETFGISIIEAQAAGLPVVGVRAGAMIDRVPSAFGRLGPPGDANAMAANITAVWLDRLSNMGARAQKHALENFSWRETFETLFFRIYRQACEKRGARIDFGRDEAKAQSPRAATG